MKTPLGYEWVKSLPPDMLGLLHNFYITQVTGQFCLHIWRQSLQKGLI